MGNGINEVCFPPETWVFNNTGTPLWKTMWTSLFLFYSMSYNLSPLLFILMLSLSQVWLGNPLQAAFCVLLTCVPLFFDCFSAFGLHKMSRLTQIFPCPSPGQGHFSKEAQVLQWKMMSVLPRGPTCAQACPLVATCSFTLPRALQRRKEGSQHSFIYFFKEGQVKEEEEYLFIYISNPPVLPKTRPDLVVSQVSEVVNIVCGCKCETSLRKSHVIHQPLTEYLPLLCTHLTSERWVTVQRPCPQGAGQTGRCPESCS